MDWNKPSNVWQWLLLLLPAVAALLALQLARAISAPIPLLNDHRGHEFVDFVAIMVRETGVTLGTILVCTVGIAVFFTRGRSMSRRLPAIIALVISIGALNAGVAFVGCAMVPHPRPSSAPVTDGR